MRKEVCIKTKIQGEVFEIRTGKFATQADTSVLVGYKDNLVLTTLVVKEPQEDIDFLPLLVEFQEKAYARGRIPGGFIKREGKPSDQEILSARLIDRNLRCMVDKNYRNNIQLISTVVSADEHDICEILGLIGASCCLLLHQDVPFYYPIAAIRLGKIRDKFIIFPTFSELSESEFDLTIGGYLKDKEFLITAIECCAKKELKEDTFIKALLVAKSYLKELYLNQLRLRSAISEEEKPQFIPQATDEELREKVKNLMQRYNFQAALFVRDKISQLHQISELVEKIKNEISQDQQIQKKVENIINEETRDIVRQSILKDNKRPDLRSPEDIREISCEVGILPRAHGSALFTRGQTQALVALTLGTHEDIQVIDSTVQEITQKRFMLHYNFPPFSTKEVKPLKAPSRREIGHGVLAEKALVGLLPPEDEFPYTIRLVSDILESNGSTSMATVCGGSLALFDGGVALRSACAGISIGLVKENGKFKLLNDITGLEDDCGDMDFKIAGTKESITAIQLDLKIEGLPISILQEALKRAKDAREYILSLMQKTIPKPRKKLSPFAPRVIQLKVPSERIKDIIGPAGRTIKNIIDNTGVKINIKDGNVWVYGPDEEAVRQAKAMIEYYTQEVEIGKVYKGKVLKVVPFGAFIEVLPGKEGLLHISKLSPFRVKDIKQMIKEGEEVLVKVISIDELGRINLERAK